MPPSSMVSGRCSASICSMLLMLRPMPAEGQAHSQAGQLVLCTSELLYRGKIWLVSLDSWTR